MKKLILFTVLLGFSFFGFSQDKDSEKAADSVKVKSKGTAFQGVMYGVRGGLNTSNLSFDTAPNMANKHRNSIFVGFFANIGLSNTISLMPEIQFSAEGANDEKLHLDYIQAPIFFRFRLSEKIHIGAGPQVSLKVHKVDDGIKNFAYSGVGGIEFKLSHMLFADLRYTYGFSNVFDDHLNVEAKNSNIQIGVGYKF
ncbi:porin family protein [Hwangdonia lutea]|uniref:Porin family protein n=1 Tax=Hwangdonia lutea TaxID=3075823 RepID=A0AA97HQT5_9FLAO|nr:porin family protein [Hwangdonia sp. SCSIO 19198]WOD43063.1 porin family protein [Hwangdonia sp. SCSIO 19198]